ncbi:MAG: ABC transporter ATP-binding protein [Bacillota bacterium]
MKLLNIEELTKTYRNNRGIRNLSLDIEPGDVIALLGPNGSGKTTAMKAMTGMLQKSGGNIYYKGNNIELNLKDIFNFTGAVIGKTVHYEYMTAYDNLDIIRPFIKSIKEGDIEVMLEKVGLLEYKKDRVSTFSTGMKQRLSIAKAMLHRPSLLLLDEPFSGMDIEGRTKIVALLKREVESNKLGILISSHQISDVENLVTKVCIINESNWLATETVSVIREKYDRLEDYYLDIIKSKKGMAV